MIFNYTITHWQLRLAAEVTSLASRMSSGIADVGAWMASNRLRLNPMKTELILLGLPRRIVNITLRSVRIDEAEIPLSPLVRDLGVYIDSGLFPAGSRRQNCSIGILPSWPVATNPSIAPTRCDAFARPCARSQSPGLLQQHPGQRTKWLARTASVGSQSCSASGFASSSSLASIRPHARETSLA